MAKLVMWKHSPERLKLLDARPLSTGIVILRCTPTK